MEAPTGADRRLDGRLLVGGEIVHQQNVPGPQARADHLLDVGEERRPVDRPVEHDRGDDPVQAQTSHECRRLPMAVRSGVDQPLAAGSATVEPRHVGLGGRLVEKDEPRGIHETLGEAAEEAALQRYVRARLLVGDQTFFLNLRSRRVSVLSTLDLPTFGPPRATIASAICASVRSGVSSTMARTMS